jgi:hypothetical protein
LTEEREEKAMADGDYGDRNPWRGSGDFSRRDLLETAVKCGAIYTATFEGDEQPYFGASFHAFELEADGLFARVPDPPTWLDVRDLVLWIPTEEGFREAKGTRK